MADEKPRAPRARKKTTETDAAAKPAAKKRKMAAATSRPQKSVAEAVQPGDVATLAYLLWEQGEPGDATEHWLRAEQELAAA
jgi:hypothetical protein